MLRRWWEKMAEWSQRGVVLVSENQAFPEMNCSTESPDWEESPYYLGHTLKWLRNGEHKHYSSEQLDTLGFKILACGGGLTFDILEYSTDGPYQLLNEIMPHFSDWAKAWEQLQNLENPDLIFLKEDRGTLWIDYNTGKGLLFLWESSKDWKNYVPFEAHALTPSEIKHFQQKGLLGLMNIKK